MEYIYSYIIYNMVLFHHSYPHVFFPLLSPCAEQVVNPDTTLSCMKTVPVSLAAAEQRAGSRGSERGMAAEAERWGS